LLLLVRQSYNEFMVTSSNKKTKEQLLSNLSSLRSALQHVMSGVIIADENGVVEFVNDKWLKIHNLPLEAVVHKSIFSLHQSADAVSLKYHLSKALDGQDIIDTIDHLLPNGQRIWLWVRCKAVEDTDRNTKQVMWSVSDITEQKQSEQRLQKQNNKLSVLNKLMVGRELELVKLKKKVKELESLIKK
jgi:PAS domain S-box-containing protein